MPVPVGGSIAVGPTKMLINPNNPNEMINNTIIGYYDSGTNTYQTKFLWKTIDGGKNWYGTSNLIGQIEELICHPTDSNIIYALNMDKIYKSTDSGQSFNLINTIGIWPASIKIAVTKAAPNNLYYSIIDYNTTSTNVYRSTNNGNNSPK
jgi:hypothetical protein